MVAEIDVRRIALELPGAYEQQSYGGRPSWRTEPRIFTWIPDDPYGLVVWVDSLEAKEALLTSAPDRFFTTSHYDGYPIVLVDMDTINIQELAELIRGSWILRAPRKLTKDWRRDHAIDDPLAGTTDGGRSD